MCHDKTLVGQLLFQSLLLIMICLLKLIKKLKYFSSHVDGSGFVSRWWTFSTAAGGELVVRPKTHTRECSRGMLPLTEEASRRSGGSPAQSPCHSLPSARPRRRESEPVGPQRPVRGLTSQSEKSSVL